jgi:hypothetical protein
LAQDQLTKLAQDLEREMSQASTNGAASQTSDDQKSSAQRGDATGASTRAQSTNTDQGEEASAQPGKDSNDKSGTQSNSSGQPNEQAKASGKSAQANGQQSGSAPEGEQAEGNDKGQGSQSRGQQPGNVSGGNSQRGEANSNDPAVGRSAQTARSGRNTRGRSGGGVGNDWDGAWLDNFNHVNDDRVWQGGPLTGGDFGPWSDRLREVEEVLEFPDLRNEVASARERARLMRQDFKRDQKKPDWAVVRLQVMKPLLEVRDRVADELARRDSNDALVPIDRDPVPTRYSDLVRRYYEELGKTKP